jgi:hypothetical protein
MPQMGMAVLEDLNASVLDALYISRMETMHNKMNTIQLCISF